MMVYVSQFCSGSCNDIQKARKSTCELQKNDLENSYISPDLTFLSVSGDIADDDLLELRLDVLQICDKLVVLGEKTSGIMRKEIAFANLVGMEVQYLD